MRFSSQKCFHLFVCKFFTIVGKDFFRKALGVAVAVASGKYFVGRLGLQRCYVDILSMMISYVHGPCVLLSTITRTVTEVH